MMVDIKVFFFWFALIIILAPTVMSIAQFFIKHLRTDEELENNYQKWLERELK